MAGGRLRVARGDDALPIPVEVLAGPVAALALAVWIANALWNAHKDADADVRAQRDLALAMGRESTAAVRALADELEKERSDRAHRRREGGP